MVKAVSGKGKSMCKGTGGRQNLACLMNGKHLISPEHRGGGREKTMPWAEPDIVVSIILAASL